MAQYKYRLGYTEGFNDALENKPNLNSLPEEEWMPKEKTDPSQYELQKTTDYSVYNQIEDSYDTYKIGYNWGYFHGVEERARLKNHISEDKFEKRMSEFANALKIIYLQINRERYLFSWNLETEIEKNSRRKFVDKFVNNSNEIIPNPTKLNEIKKLLSESKLQRALDSSIIYFKEQKNVEAYSTSLTFISKLMILRDDVKKGKINREDSELGKRSITKLLEGLIDADLS